MRGVGRTRRIAGSGLRGLRAVACALCFASGSALAAERFEIDVPIEITAREFEYIERGEVYVADGDVVIRQAGRRLSADWMAFSLATRRGVASGRVRLEDADQLVEAAFMQFDLDSLQGVLFDGDIDTGSGGFVVAGDVLRRRSEVDYRVEDGGFTSCRCPEEDDRLPWRVETGKADVELGGYGYARNSTVDVLGVPVAWLPWIMYPVKTERESGLLPPNFAFGGRNGVQVGVPIFLAPRHDVGVIATPIYLKNRGFKGDLEVEYVLGEASGGTIGGAYVRDDSLESEAAGLERDRWAFFVEHDQALPGRFRARVDAKAVSDNVYLDDFDDYALFRRDLFLRSTAFAFGQVGDSGRVGVVGALHFADDIQTPERFDRDNTLLQRMPDLELRVLPGALPVAERLGLAPSLDAQYVYFYQRDDPRRADPLAPVGPDRTFLDAGIDPARGVADPTRGDGIFQPGEPLLENGSRLALHPRLARPFSLGGLADLTPEVGYAQYLYDGSRRGFAERGVGTARADLRTRLFGSRALGERYRGHHRMEPFVRYTLVRTRNQSSTPVFVPASTIPQRRIRQLEPESYVLDPSDRVPDANVIAVGVDNAFGMRRAAGGADAVRGDLWASFQHDFDQGGVGALVVGGRASWRGRVQGEGNLLWDASRREVDEGLAGLRVWFGDRGWLRRPYLSGRYRFLRIPPTLAALSQSQVNQVDGGVGFRLGDRFLLDYTISYSLDDRERLAQVGTVLYASRCKCFSIGFDVIEDRTRDVFFRVRYSITGLGGRDGDPFLGVRGLAVDAGI